MENRLSAFEKINLVRGFNDGSINYIQKLLLFVITTHLGDNDFCFLSITTLMRECCIRKRNSVVDNLKILIALKLIIKIPPSDGYKSNRYRVNFEKVLITSNRGLLVTHGYQTSNPRLPDQYPWVTRLVTQGYPNRKLNNSEKKDKDKSSCAEEQKKANKQKHEWAASKNAKAHEEKNKKLKIAPMPTELKDKISILKKGLV